MRRTHVNWYPEGVSAKEKLHYGVHIENPDYAELAAWTGGSGARVDKPAALKAAIEAGLRRGAKRPQCDPQRDAERVRRRSPARMPAHMKR